MALALPDQDIDPVPGLKVFARKRILAAIRPLLNPVPSIVSPPCPPSVPDVILMDGITIGYKVIPSGVAAIFMNYDSLEPLVPALSPTITVTESVFAA